jgi:hypothetical protein
MSLREQINEHKKLASIGLVIVIVAILYMVSYRGHGENVDKLVPSQAFFTFDDGKTWFVDSSKRIPPFEYNGKTAVRAYVFSKGGNNFVGYLERFTPAAKEEMEATVAAATPGPHPPPFSAPTLFSVTGRELKRPGDTVWVSASNVAKATEICSVHSYGASVTPVQP